MGRNEVLKIIDEAARSGATELRLRGADVGDLPPEIGRLTALQELHLRDTQISALPPEIGRLTTLLWLDLNNTQISALPPEIGRLTQLTPVHLTDPPDIATLKAGGLFLHGAPIRFPPLEVVGEGMAAIGACLDDLEKRSERQWWSKVLIVGQPGVGKTMLRKRLCGEDVGCHEGSTHGIEVTELPLGHPSEAATMLLGAWDFGGQEIYHATHQFFLSERSLFLLLWNARTEADESRLEYWLDTIRARAPGAPVILVATHVDVRPEDIGFRDLKTKYRQLVDDRGAISNITGQGIDALRNLVAQTAAELPLMGQPWPNTWIAARRAVLDIDKRYIAPHELWAAMAGAGVAEAHRRVLAQWLHDLGDILYFANDEKLSDIVILDRDWATQQIYRALDDPEVLKTTGILNPDRVETLWSDLDESVRPRLLRLMERFNLTNVEARLDPEFPKTTIECGASGRDVNVAALLYGWHVSGGSAAIHRLNELVGEVRAEVRRGFEIVAFREERKIKTTHPSLFVLWPGGDRYWAGGALGMRFQMRLCCEQPGECHVIENEAFYWIEVPADWMEKVAPFVRRTLEVLKFAAPFVAPGLGIAAEESARSLSNKIKLMETIVKALPEPERTRGVDAEMGRMTRMAGADLRAFHTLLDEKDPDRRYQGLEHVLTPEGHYFWLCPHHARAYKR